MIEIIKCLIKSLSSGDHGLKMMKMEGCRRLG